MDNDDIDLRRWITNLPQSRTIVPITDLAIPGSHDSLSYSITLNSSISPDADRCIRFAYAFMGPLVKRVMYKWCVTQKACIKEQLALGIRYFDIRISLKEGDEKHFYFVHGMYGGSVEEPLREIQEFLEENPREIVVLDFQHFYNFSQDDHIRLATLLDNIFGDTVCPYHEPVCKITLSWMHANDFRVIIVYRNRQYGLFWPSRSWPTPWPNTMSTDYLITFLSQGVDFRPLNCGYVSQCVLTPTKMAVLRAPFVGLYQRCAVPALRASVAWLCSLPESTSVNVAIADFVHVHNGVFPLTVVRLNYDNTFC